jgi:hypothetical protein
MKFVSDLHKVCFFSLTISVSSPIKSTTSVEITEILLNVALNTNSINPFYFESSGTPESLALSNLIDIAPILETKWIEWFMVFNATFNNISGISWRETKKWKMPNYQNVKYSKLKPDPTVCIAR